MAPVEFFSIDPRGEWSPVQLRKVLDILDPEAWALGLTLRAVDITAVGMPVPRFIISVRCTFHDRHVSYDNYSCAQCRAVAQGEDSVYKYRLIHIRL